MQSADLGSIKVTRGIARFAQKAHTKTSPGQARALHAPKAPPPQHARLLGATLLLTAHQVSAVVLWIYLNEAFIITCCFS